MKTDRPRTVLADRYVLEDEIGRGPKGTVWRAVDRVLDRPVAVKILRPGPAAAPDLARRFTEAARSAALLSHPGMARVLDAGTTAEGAGFIVTELVQGESLRSLVAREGPLDANRAAEILGSVLGVLAAAHRAGVLHLDLKPENVLVGADGRVRVTDAGLTNAVGLGTAQPAPEQVVGGPVDHRTDLYAAGAVLYEALVGRPPNGGDVSPRAAGVRIPRSLDAVVRRALAADPADRFQAAEEFARALPPFEREETTASPDDRGSFLERWMLVPTVLALVVAAAIGVGLWLDRLEFGGPVGVRPNTAESPTPPPVAAIQVRTVSAYDPFGDSAENDGGVPLAEDGDPDTAWKSENYFDGRLNKPGVGLLFDLGVSQTVTGFRLATPAPGFQFLVLVGEDPAALVESEAPAFTSSSDMRRRIEPARGRYVLLWVTTVVPTGDGNRAEVAEFEVLGTDG